MTMAVRRFPSTSEPRTSRSAIAAPGPFDAAPSLPMHPAAHSLGEFVSFARLEAPFTPADVRGWRNIPDCVRDAVVDLLEYGNHISAATSALAISVARKTNMVELQEKLDGKASTEQLQELHRFVHSTVVGRLDDACPAHTAGQKAIIQLTSRLTQLESIVAAQDKQISHLVKEVGERASIKDLEAASLASQRFTETHTAQVVTSAVSSLATATFVESALQGKADASSIDLIVRDLHMLNSEVQTRVTKDGMVAHVDAKLNTSVSALRTSLQGSVDGTLRSISELRKAIDMKAGKDEAPGAWKAKVASLTVAFDSKLTKAREEVVDEVKKEMERQVNEVVEAVNKKAFKADVTRALAAKVNTEDFETALRSKADAATTLDTLKRKVEFNELAALKKTLVDVAQAVLAGNTTAISSLVAPLRGAGAAVGGVSLGTTLSNFASMVAVPLDGSSPSSLEQAAATRKLATQLAELQARVDTEIAARYAAESRDSALSAAGVGYSKPLLEEMAGKLADKADWVEVDKLRVTASGAHALVDTLKEQVAVLSAEVQALRDDLARDLTETSKRTQNSSVSLAPAPAPAAVPLPVPRYDLNASTTSVSGAPTSVTGRWVWKSRILGAGNLVVWDTQPVNTTPQFLLWNTRENEGALRELSGSAAIQTDATTVTTVRPGLYKLSLGFFAVTIPEVTVLVNGSPAISSPPPIPIDLSSTSTTGLTRGSARTYGEEAPAAQLVGATVVHTHPAGSVGGVTITHFLALPHHAQVSVAYEGGVRGQGFLELSKL